MDDKRILIKDIIRRKATYLFHIKSPTERSIPYMGNLMLVIFLVLAIGKTDFLGVIVRQRNAIFSSEILSERDTDKDFLHAVF